MTMRLSTRHLIAVVSVTSGSVLAACGHAGPRQDVPAPAPEGPAVVTVPVRQRAQRMPFRPNLDQFVIDVPLPADTGECGDERPSPRDDGQLVSTYYPTASDPIAVSTVMVDTAGRIINFSDRRGVVKLGGAPGGGPVRPDSALAVANRTTRSTTIVLDYRQRVALITNEGAGRPEQSIVVPIAEAVYHPKLDAPERRARAIVARCRKR